MEGTEVVLQDMLSCREARAIAQRDLLLRYHCTLVSFCMNIPGPVKTNAQIREAFEQGKGELLAALQEIGAPIRSCREIHEKTGDEMLLAVDAPAEKVKDQMMKIEESHPLGRLFDMDVLDSEGNKLSRPVYRKCLICGRQAQDCARARRHTVAGMQAAIQALLDENL